MAKIPEGEYLCARIRRAEQALMTHHEAALRAYGLTMTQYTVLLTLSREGGKSGAQLAKSCGVSQQSMGSVLANLQAKGLIQREVSSAHAKVLIALPTKKGAALLDKAYQEVIVLEGALADVFSATEHRSLCNLLDRATDVLVRQSRGLARSTNAGSGRKNRGT